MMRTWTRKHISVSEELAAQDIARPIGSMVMVYLAKQHLP